MEISLKKNGSSANQTNQPTNQDPQIPAFSGTFIISSQKVQIGQ